MRTQEKKLKALMCKGDVGKFVNADTLLSHLKQKFQLILADPSDKKDEYIMEITTMFNLLETGGQLISLSPAAWLQGESKEDVSFRQFVEEHGFFYVVDMDMFKDDNPEMVLLVFKKRG